MAQFLSLAGLAQTIAPLNIIGQGFNVTDEAQLSWYPAAFSLTLGTFILPAGRLGDMYGHRNMYMLGFAWYAVWSVVAGVAVFGGGDILFSTCRGLQGIWCALLVPNALALVGRTYGASPKKNMIVSTLLRRTPLSETSETSADGSSRAKVRPLRSRSSNRLGSWSRFLFHSGSAGMVALGILGPGNHLRCDDRRSLRHHPS